MDEKKWSPDEKLHCSRCGQDKLRSEFYRRTASPDDLSAYCKACVLQYQRTRRENIKARLARADRVPDLEERIVRLEGELRASQDHHEVFMEGMRMASGKGHE